MVTSMSPTNSRKRAAPGTSPTPQMAQTYPTNNQMSNPDFRWNQGDDSLVFPDHTATTYNMNSYNGNNVAQQQPYGNQQASSTQLARRPMNQQLVQTQQRYDGSDNWGGFGDEQNGDGSGANGGMEVNDNIELLEERAAVAKRDSQSKRKQIPPFVQKLSSFLDESKNTELIRWSDRGDSFVVLDEDEFAKTLIPELFKHNNYASFVRQLNMYGFHKRVGLSDNSMKASERKNKSPSEYYNPYFKRGHPNLLWLINKPKSGAKGNGKAKNGARKPEEIQDRDSDEDGQDIEEVIGNVGNYPAAITQSNPSSSLERQNMSNLQNQLMDIQKQQGAITNAIARLRKDHNQLYQQSIAFQTLHDRHENSINAILTFLATVYNRSLDGQGPQNIAQMFANGIPQDQQSGSVVDVTGQQDPHPGSRSPHRRQQRLLMAPPTQGGNGRVASATPSIATNTPAPQPQNYATPNNASIEELFDSPGDTTDPQGSSTTAPGAQNIMNIIQNTNAHHRASSQSHAIQFPDMLSHYENTHGASLTPEQRNAMLNNMNMLQTQSGNTPININNALASPIPPTPPSLESLNMTQQEIDHLYKLQQEQDQRISNIAKEVEPLSPSGSIPGLSSSDGVNSNPYFNPNDFPNPGDASLDLDQYLDDGAFYGGNASPGGNIDFGNNAFGSDPGFDLGMGIGSGNGFDDLGLSDGMTDGMGAQTGKGNVDAGKAGEKQSVEENEGVSRKRRRGN